MKKSIVFIFFVILLGTTVFAQKKVHIGVKGGFINTDFSGTDNNDFDKRAGFSTGVFFHTISKKGFFGIQPEMLYAQKGAFLIKNDLKTEYLFHYAETPIMFKISIPIKVIHIKALIGPYAGFKIQENITEKNLLTNEVRKVTDDTSGFDFGMTGGAGIDLMLGSLLLTADARYNLGFKELGGVDELEDVKNSNFSINVGVGIKI